MFVYILIDVDRIENGRATLNGEELENFAQNEHERGIKLSVFIG
jgi:hypothetical protein